MQVFFFDRLFFSVESNILPDFLLPHKFEKANIYLITKEDLGFLVILEPAG